jgi:Zn-dependent M28 family amino/carboxypeptidase
VEVDAFTAATPAGGVGMKNIVARFPGTSGRAIVISGHYDTKRLDSFVGANDGGSSAGFLLELARALTGAPRRDDVILVWFDGEEAVSEWSETDGTYGSRHLAAKWAAEGKLARVKALINVDMIGDRDLGLVDESNSTPALRRLLREAAPGLLRDSQPIEDDHLPFLRRGVPALDLIDFNYGPSNAYWHTTADTVDKLGASSFDATARIVLELIRRLESLVIE